MDNNVFPLPFYVHLIFVCLSFLLFIYQFTRHRRMYQVLMAVAVPATMLLYINTGKTWHYIVGFIEIALLAASIVISVIESRRAKKALKAETPETGDKE